METMNYKYELETNDSYVIPSVLRPNINSTLTLRSEYNILSKKCLGSPLNFNKSNDCNYYQDYDNGLRYAGMKIFAAIMVHSWRKSKDELFRLQSTIDSLKKATFRSNNDIHIYNQLIQMKEKRNDELTIQLRKAMANYKHAKTSCETMKTTMMSIKADKALLEEELKIKYEEYDALHAILAQTKTDLFHCKMDQRNLKSQLNKEQINIQELENQKNKLIGEMCLINAECRKKEDKFNKELEEKEMEIRNVNVKLTAMQRTLENLKRKTEPLESVEINNSRMKMEIDVLRCQVDTMRTQINNSFSNRLRILWRYFTNCQKSTIHLMHVFAFYLLPATPSPYPKTYCYRRMNPITF